MPSRPSYGARSDDRPVRSSRAIRPRRVRWDRRSCHAQAAAGPVLPGQRRPASAGGPDLRRGTNRLDHRGLCERGEGEFEAVRRQAISTRRSCSASSAALDYIEVDALGNEGWGKLAARLGEAPERIRVYYLATAPTLFGPICKALARVECVTPLSRVVLEKPLGRDLASAQVINDEVGQVFAEDQTYRIDHYLGKETVQNLITLRFANFLFEPLWNANAIDHVQITVAEKIGVGERGELLRQVWCAARHGAEPLLQLLCLVAMEPPPIFGSDPVRDEKLKVLRALKPIGDREVIMHGARPIRSRRRRRQRRARLPGRARVRPSNTETFVVVRAEVENWRWAGVPFYLRTGKRMATRASEIIIQYRSVPHSIFRENGRDIVPEPPGAASPTGRGNEALSHEQGPRPGRFAIQEHASQLELCGGIHSSVTATPTSDS